MKRLDQTTADFDEAMLDQDFDEWQNDNGYDGFDRDHASGDIDDPAFDEIVHDSHFHLGELDFAH